MYNTLRKNIYAAIAALFITMLALPTTAQAQGKARIILEAHNVWGDGSGYQMLLDADHNLYGDKIPEKGALWDNANPPADLYNSFEYKIPGNADPSTTPQYMVVDGEGYVDIPAGVYDFCIAAPEAGKKIWIAGDKDGPTRADDYRFEAGKTYRFTMYTPDGGGDAAKLTITQTGEVQNYNLEIAGKQVTSDNCNNLSVIPGVSGSVIYDPQSNILTLENATIDTTSPNAIDSRIDNLTINLIGTNRLVTANTSTIRITKPLTLTGGGTLNVNSLSRCGIYTYNTDLTIIDCVVTVVGHEGIAGEYGSGGKLLIKNATVTAEGKDGSICDFGSLTLEGCAITQPAGAAFDPSQNAVVLDGEVVTSEVVISPQSTTEYDLKIVGNNVTFDNCGDLTVFDGVSGTVKYDPRSNILTLKDATITSTTTNAIVSRIDGLTIELIGTNSLTTKENSTLSFTHPLTLTGGGTLNVNSQNDCGIYLNNTDLTINNCIVNVKGYYGIAGKDGSNEKLLIRNATVTAEGEKGSICDLNSLTLEGCAITQPEGAKFDPSEKAVALNGEKVTSKVVISPQSTTEYDLWIAGKQVRSDNCGDLSRIDGVSGTVKYNPQSNILTLKDATITSTTTNAIVSYIDGLTIELIGTNSLTTNESSTLSFTHPLTLTGGGTLNVSALSECGIFLNNTDLTINDCIVNVKGYYGIAGKDGSNEKLLIRNATVTAEGEQGSICDLASLTLEYSNISQPSGAAFDGSLHGIALGGKLVKTQVVITRDPAGINTPTIDTAAKQGIYTISGVKLNGETKDLPKGIYIVNGKKVVKK